jgi:glycosyltransferase involved in cell wall biosynthesis
MTMTGQPDKGNILFVSSMPASRSNAIGVLTLHFAEPFTPDWRHCYWDTSMGRSSVPNSYCLNSRIPALWPFATGRGFLTRQIERLGLGWWKGDGLIESRKPQLQRLFPETRFAYVTPLRNSEATKCREIVETMGCPFVVQIWDICDEAMNADYAWLFSRSERVFCLSETMVDEVHKLARCETSILRFTRTESRYKAEYSGPEKLVIGLVGFLSAYQDGLELLAEAIDCLQKQFADVRIRYIGPIEQMSYIPQRLKQFTEFMGFHDQDGVDKALANCNAAYLPGPLRSPQSDLRSRHSIPSRSADYMAAGLPIIAAVNSLSATNILFSPIRDRGFFPVNDPASLCQAAQKLKDEEFWTDAAQECDSFFRQNFDIRQAQDKLCAVANRFL